MHYQTKTREKIIESEGNYVFGLKENQKNMFDNEVELKNAFAGELKIFQSQEITTANGKITTETSC